jgi:hypothetical protein
MVSMMKENYSSKRVYPIYRVHFYIQKKMAPCGLNHMILNEIFGTIGFQDHPLFQ